MSAASPTHGTEASTEPSAGVSAGGSSQRMGRLLETLELSSMQKEILRQRWLDQVTWMGRQARRARRSYLALRIPVVIGGVAIPALIAILLSAGPATTVPFMQAITTESVRLFAFFVSLLVAGLAALDEVLKYGDRWRHYRRTAELLKTFGWQYLTLSGTFKRFDTHAQAFTTFTERVEDVLNEDVEGYLTTITVEGGDKRHEVVV
jgi:hypothetical protein